MSRTPEKTAGSPHRDGCGSARQSYMNHAAFAAGDLEILDSENIAGKWGFMGEAFG